MYSYLVIFYIYIQYLYLYLCPYIYICMISSISISVRPSVHLWRYVSIYLYESGATFNCRLTCMDFLADTLVDWNLVSSIRTAIPLSELSLVEWNTGHLFLWGKRENHGLRLRCCSPIHEASSPISTRILWWRSRVMPSPSDEVSLKKGRLSNHRNPWEIWWGFL